MKQHRSAIVAAIGVLSCLLLVTVARSWFITMNETPPGLITAGVVRYLPENVSSHANLFMYGNLISGNSIDEDGIPHVLPGDRLLPASLVTVTGGTATHELTTSTVRNFVSGETEGTVISCEERQFAAESPLPNRIILRRQRDLMLREAPADIWTHQGVVITTPPTLGELSSYRAVTTTSTAVTSGISGGFPSTITTTTTVVTYTRADGDHYVCTSLRIVTITHEAATFTEGGQPATGFEWDAALALPYSESVETVLFTAGVGGLTRSHLVLTEHRASKDGEHSSPGGSAVSLPLSVGNLSTVPTNVRIAVTAALQPSGGTVEPLEFRLEPGTGFFCVGKLSDGAFIELLRLKPAETPGYGWVATPDAPAVQPVWDLALTAPAEGTAATVIPPVLPPVDGVESPPDRYAALAALNISIAPSFGTNQETFEREFNNFYCTNSPKIILKVTYLAKQSDYMDWSSFHSESLTLQF